MTFSWQGLNLASVIQYKGVYSKLVYELLAVGLFLLIL